MLYFIYKNIFLDKTYRGGGIIEDILHLRRSV